jgi:hypothetical protein
MFCEARFTKNKFLLYHLSEFAISISTTGIFFLDRLSFMFFINKYFCYFNWFGDVVLFLTGNVELNKNVVLIFMRNR